MSDCLAFKLGLAIPTLNEAGNIGTLLESLHDVLLTAPIGYEIIVVDDDSKDGTAEVAREYGRRDPRVRVFTRQGKRGLAGAVMYGWAQTDANLLGVIDAVLQHPPLTETERRCAGPLIGRVPAPPSAILASPASFGSIERTAPPRMPVSPPPRSRSRASKS